MTFTEEDAENDGLIKREAGSQLNSVMSRSGGKLYRKFLQYCEENGRDPATVLGDMILRAIRDEDYAEAVSNTVVQPEKLNRDKIKREDVELVNDLIETFSDGSDNGQDPIDELVQQRLQAIGTGPLGAMGQQQQGGGAGGPDKDDVILQRLDNLERKVESNVEQTAQQQQGEQDSEGNQEELQDVDNLFGSEGSDEEQEQIHDGEGNDRGSESEDADSDEGESIESTVDSITGSDSGPDNGSVDDDSLVDEDSFFDEEDDEEVEIVNNSLTPGDNESDDSDESSDGELSVDDIGSTDSGEAESVDDDDPNPMTSNGAEITDEE